MLLTSFYSPKRMRRMWVLERDEMFIVGDYIFTVPKGYSFDGASVPRFLWTFASPTGRAFEAACLHDWLYDTKGLESMRRKEIDDIFILHMKKTGVGFIQRHLFYIAVRLFGSIYWKRESQPKVYETN